MFRFFTKIILFLILTIGLQAQSGLSQNHLASVSPIASEEAVSTDATIEIEFKLPIVARSVKTHTIVLKNIMESGTNKKIVGTTTLKNETTLLFIPSETLKSGTYTVKVKKVKLLDYAINTRFKRFAKKVCSYFYDDVTECRLYRHASSVKSKKINYSFSVDDVSPKILSIKLTKSNIELSENNQTTITVNALYDDNTTEDITEDIEWLMSDNSIISISKNTITPLTEGTTTLQAKYNTQMSAKIQVNIYKEINGYKLPPEPDPVVNNSTLLGIDSNDNGVRDDVERYVIKRYAQDPEFPKTKTALAMQYAWAVQKKIDNPVIESRIYTKDAVDCEAYWLKQKTKDMPILEDIQYSQKHGVFNDADINDKIYNTRERIERSFEFNRACSGNIFDGREAKLEYCHTNLDELGE